MEKQTTISKPVSFTGIGIHTGNHSTITFHPASADYGYRFVRRDVPEEIEIEAITENVVDLSRGTTIGKNGVKIHTVEHVLSALVGLRIDNCKIELTSNEPPVLDGSAMPYVQALQQAEVVKLDKDREYYVVEETIRYANDEKAVEIIGLPTDDYRITVMIDYFNPALGSQHTGLFNLDKEFVTEFAPARTFCFLTEVEMLQDLGLIKGGSLSNAVVIIDKEITDEELVNIKERFKLDYIPKPSDNGILDNTQLRFKNEPARHKLLDMLGDLALVGVPIKAQILAARPGHASNFEFAKKIRELYLKKKSQEKYIVSKASKKVVDIYELMKFLPHRYPFLLIDRVIDYDEEKKKVIGYKNITFNEPYFVGHFPEKPVMPGVLIIEALAQTGGFLIMQMVGDVSTKLAFFSTINNAKFRKPVIPGDQLVMEVQLTSKKFNIYSFKGVAVVDGQIVAEAELQAAILDR